MIQETLLNILNGVWPMIIIVTVLVISLRLAYIISNHKKIYLHKELLMLFFIVYVLCLFHLVTYQDVNLRSSSNFIPFKEMLRYDLFSKLFIKNVLGNVIIFIPYGLWASYILKTKKFVYPFILTIILSTTIEIVQYNIGRVFDIDDIILNVIGGILGYLLYIAFNAIRKKLPNFMKSDTFINIVLIIIIVLIFLYSFNIKIFG